MLTIQYDDYGKNYSVHQVTAVHVEPETEGDDRVLLVKAQSGDRLVEMRICTDANATAQQGADRIALAVSQDIFISPYEERHYLYLNTGPEPGDDQIKVTGQIIKTAFDK